MFYWTGIWNFEVDYIHEVIVSSYVDYCYYSYFDMFRKERPLAILWHQKQNKTKHTQQNKQTNKQTKPNETKKNQTKQKQQQLKTKKNKNKNKKT